MLRACVVQIKCSPANYFPCYSIFLLRLAQKSDRETKRLWVTDDPIVQNTNGISKMFILQGIYENT